MNEITLRIDQKRLDYIINVLAQRPYAEVAETLQNIAQQIQASQQQAAPPLVKPNGAADTVQEAGHA